MADHTISNEEFLKAIEESFAVYLQTDPRSNKKLMPLHGTIARDVVTTLGPNYTVQSLGYDRRKVEILDGSYMEKSVGGEETLEGKYMNKRVDISVRKNGRAVGALAVKFVESNYCQNSNNYFEDMLGETVNIRSAGMDYFQVLVLPRRTPYYERDTKRISKIEDISAGYLEKYINISKEDADSCKYVPNRMLIFMIEPKIEWKTGLTREELAKDQMKNGKPKFRMTNERYDFGKAIIFNDYPRFIKEVCDQLRKV